MKKHVRSGPFIKTGCLLFITAVLFIIHSCRKDLKTNYGDITDPEVQQAMEWYNQANPTTPASANSTTVAQIATSGTNGNARHTDLSQYTGPDWYHPTKYTRYNKNVIELSVNPAHTLHAAFQNPNTGKTCSGKYSKSSYLIIRDGSDYHAYIMTIIADSAYLKNDFSKLNRNTYSKREKDFSGMVIYQTPKGDFISSYRYTNGRLATKPAQTTDNPANISTQTTPTTDEGGTYTCTDWFLVNYIDDVPVSATFLYRECIYNGDGHSTSPSLGNGGGSGGAGCPTGYTPASVIKVNTLDTPIGGIDDGDGFPPPNTTPSTVGCRLIVQEYASVTDSIKNKCLDSALIAITDTAIKNLITTWYNNNALGATSKIDITFEEVPNITATRNDGSGTIDTSMAQSLHASGSTNYTINLNSAYLSMPGYNMSREAWAQVILHEILHVWMSVNFPALDHKQLDHAFMFKSLIDPSANLLKSAFGMSSNDATDLALNGLGDLWQYSDYEALCISKYGRNKTQIYGTFDAYSKQTKGKKCN